MANFYATFGSDPNYPYGRGVYVKVEAKNVREARQLYSMVHPPRNPAEPNVINCADMYTEEEWKDAKQRGYYNDDVCIEEISVFVMKNRVVDL